MATNYDLNITRGSKFSVRLAAKNEDGTPINLSGYNVRGNVKYTYGSTGTLLDLKPTGVVGYYESGYIDIDLLAGSTTNVPIVQGVYDVEIYSGTYVDKLIKGYVNILPEVTTS